MRANNGASVRSAISIHSYEAFAPNYMRFIIASADRESGSAFPSPVAIISHGSISSWAFKKNLFARDDAFLGGDGVMAGATAGGAAP